MDGMVEEMRSGCAEGSDPTACIKYKVMSLLDSIFKKDTFQVQDFFVIWNTFYFRIIYFLITLSLVIRI